MKWSNLLVLSLALTLFSTLGHAKKYHAGDGTIVVAGVQVNASASSGRQFQAVAVSYDGNGDPTTTEGSSHRTGPEAAKAAERLARKVASEQRKQARKDVRELNKGEREGLWKKFKALFKKNKDTESVMLGPDGQGDYRGGGSWPVPGSDSEIHIQF